MTYSKRQALHLPPTEHLPDVVGHSNAPLRTASTDIRFEEEIDFGQYVRPLRRHWMIIAVACVVGAIIGLIVSARRPILYEASTTVLVQQATSGEAFSPARALLRNYTLASETVKEVGLAMTGHAFVNNALVIEESGGTHLLNVKVRLGDPALAAKASYLLSTKAVKLNRQVATEGNLAVREQLKVLLDDASRRLDAAEQELLTARTGARLEVAKKDAELMLDGRAELQDIAAQIASEKGRLAAAEEELKHHQPVLGTPRAPEAEAALRQSGAAEGQPRSRDVVSQDSGAAPAKRPVSPDIDTLPDLSNPFVNPVYQTLQFQIAMGRARLAGLERERQQIAAAGGGAGAITQLYRNELAIARLETNYDLAKKVYSELAVRFEQSRVDSIGNMVRLQIVDPATPPDRPMPRKRMESGLLGLVGGFFLASLIVVFAMPAEREDGPRPRQGTAQS